MNFLRGFGFAAAEPSEPPPSVLSEWNKYAAGDIEAGGAKPALEPAATGTGFASSLQGMTFGFPGSTAGQTAPASTSSSMPR